MENGDGVPVSPIILLIDVESSEEVTMVSPRGQTTLYDTTVTRDSHENEICTD